MRTCKGNYFVYWARISDYPDSTPNQHSQKQPLFTSFHHKCLVADFIHTTLRLMSEHDLVKLCLKGDIRAQRHLYVLYAPRLKAICLRYASGKEEAEDMLQEAFVRIFSKLSQFKQDGPLGAWIRRVTVNTAAEIYRRDKKLRWHVDVEDYAQQVVEPDDILATLEAESLVQKINCLPDGYRVVFNMFAIEGFTHKEIGDILGITESTSKSQYSRARQALRGMLEKEMEAYRVQVG
jgi:RNA polymerase sigma-70 factor (ECF subfamily)